MEYMANIISCIYISISTAINSLAHHKIDSDKIKHSNKFQ